MIKRDAYGYLEYMSFERAAMADIKVRPLGGRIEKKRQRKILGTSLTRFTVGHRKRVFVVHQDLICSHSPTFKKSLQNSRKAIYGECCICSSKMEPLRHEIHYCSTYGQNVHATCIANWFKRERTCPYCRAGWNPKQGVQAHDSPELDDDAFAIYIDWLCTDFIPGPDDEDVDESGKERRLIDAYLLGQTIEDLGFQKVITKELHAIWLGNPSVEVVQYIYDKTDGPCNLRRFLIDYCYTLCPPNHNFDRFSKDFVLDLLKIALKNRTTTSDKKKQVLGQWGVYS